MELSTNTPKPRSEKQIEAAKINGAKSKGRPVTLRGRFDSTKHNARHIMLARSVVLDNESPDRFLALLCALEQRFEPADELEHALVESIAVARWRQGRLWELERAALRNEMRHGNPSPAPPDQPTRAWFAFCSLNGSGNPLEILSRHQSRCDQQIDRAIDRLNKLRTLRKADELDFSETEDLIPVTD